MSDKIIQLRLADKAALHRAYMPFLKPGGLFVPSDRPYRLGDEIFVLLVLPEEETRRPFAGKVVWINTSASPERPLGVGAAFMEGAASEGLKSRIEVLLAGYSGAEKATHTM